MPLYGRHRWPRIVKPIALGWLLTAAIATSALAQSDGRDQVEDLRTTLDEGSGRALPHAADLTARNHTALFAGGRAPRRPGLRPQSDAARAAGAARHSPTPAAAAEGGNPG
jgi:hypothetical protein